MLISTRREPNYLAPQLLAQLAGSFPSQAALMAGNGRPAKEVSVGRSSRRQGRESTRRILDCGGPTPYCERFLAICGTNGIVPVRTLDSRIQVVRLAPFSLNLHSS